MQKYLEIDGRTYYAFEEPDFVGPLPNRRRDPEPYGLAAVDRYDEGHIERRYWRRQFGLKTMTQQMKFDWLFGLIMPAVCFFFDPIVFRDWDSGGRGILGEYKTFAYMLSGMSIMALTTWLLWGERVKWLAAPLAGILIAGGLVSGIIGILLFPFSLMGLVMLIGLLGFTPLFTSIVFLRNARRLLRCGIAAEDPRTFAYIAALSGGTAIVIPWLLNF